MSENRKWESGAQRDGDWNKPYVHNIMGYTRLRFGYHMRTGSRKYGDTNWLKGMPSTSYLQSVDRHLALYMEGDRSEDHLSAILFGIQGCMINEQNEGIKVNEYFKMGDGDFQRPNRDETNHTLEDMPIEFKYNYSDDSITRGELSVLAQEYPNDAELGAELRKRVSRKVVTRILDKEMD